MSFANCGGDLLVNYTGNLKFQKSCYFKSKKMGDSDDIPSSFIHNDAASAWITSIAVIWIVFVVSS